MKRILPVLLILCLIAVLMSGCAQTLPSLPPMPGKDTSNMTQENVEPEEDNVAVSAEPVDVDVPQTLQLLFELPVAAPGEDSAYYFSPKEDFDCAFVYPSYCSVWVEKGSIRLNPGWFFARMFFTSVLRDGENAPDELPDLLETGKWGTYAEEGTAGTGWTALRALHLKYDTWRRWVAWETPERFYLLYGSCFDGREEAVINIFEMIAASFHTSEELLVHAPEQDALLRQDDALSLFFDGAELGGGDSPSVRVSLRAVNRSNDARELVAPVYTADGREFPFDVHLNVPANEEWNWTLTLPLIPEEGGAPFENIAFVVGAYGEDTESLFELPVEIGIK